MSSVSANAPGRTSTSTGAARSIRVNPETDRDSEASAGSATVQAERTTGKRRMPLVRAGNPSISRRPATSALHRSATGARKAIQETIQDWQGRLESGETFGQERGRVPPPRPELVGRSLHP